MSEETKNELTEEAVEKSAEEKYTKTILRLGIGLLNDEPVWRKMSDFDFEVLVYALSPDRIAKIEGITGENLNDLIGSRSDPDAAKKLKAVAPVAIKHLVADWEGLKLWDGDRPTAVEFSEENVEKLAKFMPFANAIIAEAFSAAIAVEEAEVGN